MNFNYCALADKINDAKVEAENCLINKILEKYDCGDTLRLAEGIKMHCPRGMNRDIVVSKICYNKELILVFMEDDEEYAFTKFDFGAEDFLSMVYAILRDNL